MMDCGLDMSPLQFFLPNGPVKSQRMANLPTWKPPGHSVDKMENIFRECGGRIFIDGPPEFCVPETGLLDMSDIDAILISNSHNMLALPFITEYTGFKGKVYATEPTLQVGRQFMEELVQFVEKIPKKESTSVFKQESILKVLPAPLKDAANVSSWKQLYDMHDVNHCLSRVKMVGFNEKVDIFGALTVTPFSSGYSLGSSNWIIQSDYEKVAYLSSSSTLTTHPKPIEQAPLRNTDVLILSNLIQVPTHNPDAMIRDFCINATLTLRNGGNVLVPCFPTGVTFDLFECLSAHMDTCSLSHVPMYFISPVVDSSLAYSNIFAEWLSASKQSKVYLPEPPFPHAELLKILRLRPFSSLNDGMSDDFRTPCVIFTGHPSLRFGEAVHFLELWGKSSQNMVIFTEPDFPYLDALAPYQPLAMTVSYCPIDTSLNFSQANKLIRDLKPLSLVTADVFINPPPSIPNRPDLIVEADPSPITYQRCSVLSLPLRRGYEKLEIEPKLAGSLVPVEVQPGVAVASVTGNLEVKDGKYVLKTPSDEKPSKKRKTTEKVKKYIWGNVEIQQFRQALNQQGIMEVKVDDVTQGSYIVHLPNEDSLIRIEDGATHIICDGEDSARIKIRDALLQCLNTL
ncbi:integrator complex subunit 9-like isoform X2 [Lineus longissimus]